MGVTEGLFSWFEQYLDKDRYGMGIMFYTNGLSDRTIVSCIGGRGSYITWFES